MVMSRCHNNKDILNNGIFAVKMSLLSERHLMTVVINPTSYSRHMSCHGYEGTPLQVKCYPNDLKCAKKIRAKIILLLTDWNSREKADNMAGS